MEFSPYHQHRRPKASVDARRSTALRQDRRHRGESARSLEPTVENADALPTLGERPSKCACAFSFSTAGTASSHCCRSGCQGSPMSLSPPAKRATSSCRRCRMSGIRMLLLTTSPTSFAWGSFGEIRTRAKSGCCLAARCSCSPMAPRTGDSFPVLASPSVAITSCFALLDVSVRLAMRFVRLGVPAGPNSERMMVLHPAGSCSERSVRSGLCL